MKPRQERQALLSLESTQVSLNTVVLTFLKKNKNQQTKNPVSAW